MKKYIRKTADEYEVQGNYGQYGFECLTTEDNFKAARKTLKDYRDNDKSGTFRIIKKRIKI